MEVETKNRSWIPYIIFVIGTTISAAVFVYFYYDYDDYLEKIIPTIDDHFSWISFTLCQGLTVMIALIVGFAEQSRHRAIKLAKANEDLMREIEERLMAEKAKQTMEAAMMQGQKLQAMGTLAGGIAHDFNNLLYAIIGYVEMARDDTPEDSKIHANLGKVLEASHRGQDLVSRILTFSRRQQHQFDAIDLKQTIEAVLGLLKPTIPASVELDCNLDIDCHVLGNKTKIHQVFVNLITNAVDAMDGEGNIRIHASMLDKDDPEITNNPDLKPQSYCKITIEDTGHGIPKEKLNRIFEPFYTTKEVGKGTGLGLSIVHTIIKEHEGNISVNSEIGQGTTFVILLPETEVTADQTAE